MTKLNYKTFIGITMMLILIFFFAYLGVYALQKSMSIKMGFTIQPNVRCELYASIDGGTENLIFSNRNGEEFIRPGWTLDSSTSTLTYNQSITGTLGGGFDLTVKNYTPNAKIFVETAGNGVSYNSILLDAFENIENISQETLTIATTSGLASINFIPVYNYFITPTFEHATFDLTAENNTLIKIGNYYYIPLGRNATTTIVAEPNYEYPTLTNLTIGGVNKLADYFNTETKILNIPFANINGQILITCNAYIPYDITFNKQGGTGGTSSTTAYLGITSPTTITAPTKTGYSFGGYYYDNNLENYVQDNMLMWLDGIYNNGVGNPHSTTATTWRDISGNNKNCGFNGTGPTWNATNGISLDGSDDGIYIGDQLQDLFKSSNTCEFYLRSDDLDRVIVMGNYLSYPMINYELNTYPVYGFYPFPLVYAGPDNLYSAGEYFLFTVLWDKTNSKIIVYKNGEFVSDAWENDDIGTWTGNYSSAWFGRDNDGSSPSLSSRFLTGDFYSIRIYNRLLTATEIAQNYNADIARFGANATLAVANSTQIFNASGVGSGIWNYARNSILYARWN